MVTLNELYDEAFEALLVWHPITCPNCNGRGEVMHPRWGARNCPEPTITCPMCRGRGETDEESIAMWEDDYEPTVEWLDFRTRR